MSHSFRGKKSLFSIGSFLILLQLAFAVNLNAQTGEDLFNANCASCHKVHSDYTGPALKGAKGRWQKAYSDTLKIYEWVKNPNSVINQGGYASELFTKWKASGIMTAQPLSDDQITLVLNYIETAPEPTEGGGATASVEVEAKEEGGSGLWWIIIGVVFLIIATAVGTVRRQLVNANREKDGLEPLPEQTYFQTWASWAWRNKVFAGFIVFFFLMGGLVDGTYKLMDVGVFENYKPEQPIKFSHKIHAGDNKINCVYCHNSAEKSRHAGIPTTNVCMNCHKAIQKGTLTDTVEISKIYRAIGFNVKANAYGTQGEPLKWVKVHNLPDHVYFNHSQHVVVGGLDCSQCHGNMEKEDVARVMPHDTLAKINKKFFGQDFHVDRATLTMGWCIECHDQAVSKGYNDEKNGYYGELKKRLLNNKALYKQHLEDDKVTVKELGGWECAKCHY